MMISQPYGDLCSLGNGLHFHMALTFNKHFLCRLNQSLLTSNHASHMSLKDLN